MPDPRLPDRWERPNTLSFGLYFLGIAFVVWSINNVGLSSRELIEGLPQMGRLLSEMFPPDLQRWQSLLWSMLETLQIAVAGTVIGIVIGLPLAILATKHLTPHPIVFRIVRGIIAMFRTVPDLIWAVFFVATVGLGAFAGTLTIAVDTIGFVGRFYAESMEEVDRRPQEALTALGTSKTSMIFCAVLPAAMPSFVNTSLFSLEQAVRSSVILGLVGAGGIGIELKVAMDMFQYAEAGSIILLVFLLVMLVESLSTHIRQKYLN
jgi:phosphonate transport system permease protein